MFKNVYFNSFFAPIAMLQNSLPAECFHLTYDLSIICKEVTAHLFRASSSPLPNMPPLF